MVIAAILLSSCQRGGSSVAPGERHFTVYAIEIKGSTTADKVPPPQAKPDELSKAIQYQAPGFDKGNPQAWQVSAYQFNPAALTVFQGDRVNLSLFVINGDVHKDRIEDPEGKIIIPEKEHHRGRMYEMSFVAEKPGFYMLRCSEHRETMKVSITVIPGR